MKYLIIDDNENIRSIIRQSICSEGDIIIECSDGDNAVDSYTKLQPDFVLMDIQMPKMDGLRTTEKIRKKFSNAKIIIITEYDSPSFRQAALKEGVIAFFSKENLIKVKQFIADEQ